MAVQLCPLYCKMFFESNLPRICDVNQATKTFSMELCHIKKMEEHILNSSCSHPPMSEFVFDEGPFRGTTPLMLACYYGQLESVKYLVEECGVDVRVPAVHYDNPCHDDIHFSDEWMEEATYTPLFVAALQGHHKIVCYLLEKGADPNVNSPLYAALTQTYDYKEQNFASRTQEDVNEIVRSLLNFGANPSPFPSWYMMFPLRFGGDVMAALIIHGIDLNERIEKEAYNGNETILHYFVRTPLGFNEEDSLAIVKVLLEPGAADLLARNNSGETPLLSAAMSIRHLNFSILDYLLERKDISRIDKIEALELAGATILFCNDLKAQAYCKAFDYWRRALRLRQMDEEGTISPIEKTVFKRGCGGPVEWTTLAQLEELVQHPSEYVIQAFLVSSRIYLSAISWKIVRYMFSCYCSNNNDPIIYLHNNPVRHHSEVERRDVLWVMLDVIPCFFKPDETGFWDLTIQVVNRLCLNMKYINSWIDMDRSTAIKRSLNLILATNPFYPPDDCERDAMNTKQDYSALVLDRLIRMLLIDFPDLLDEVAVKCFLKILRQSGCNVLGIALLRTCKKDMNLVIIRHLLKAGADPNYAVDDKGNTSLHLGAGLNSALGDEACTLLVEHGACLGRANNAGKRPADIWLERYQKNHGILTLGVAWDILPAWCRTVPILKCLTARIVRAHNVPHLFLLPESLSRFVGMH